MSRGLRWALLTAGGLGALRPAPGTWGSLPPPVLAVALVGIAGPGLHVDLALAALAVAAGTACVALGGWAEARWGRPDPGEVVADEVAGQAVALLGLPWAAWSAMGGTAACAGLAAVCFALFRVADIAKPPPCNALQRVPGGWGILLDDLAAGVYALVGTQVVARGAGLA